jgi:hypothetical protein
MYTNSSTMANNTHEIVGFDPTRTDCSAHIQVWRGWVITRDGKPVWRSTSYNGDILISVKLDGVRISLPAYRILALANICDASTIDDDTYEYLCYLLYNRKNRRSVFDVHHIDGDHYNNKGTNLAILHNHDHKQAHVLLNRIATATFSDNYYSLECAKRKYMEFINIHSSIEYIVNNY